MTLSRVLDLSGALSPLPEETRPLTSLASSKILLRTFHQIPTNTQSSRNGHIWVDTEWTIRHGHQSGQDVVGLLVHVHISNIHQVQEAVNKIYFKNS